MLRKILKEANKKIAVLMNEFGEISVDAEIIKGKAVDMIELQGGCVCCSLTGEFEEAIKEVLEKAKEGDLIFLCSYGSGAGSDSFVLKVTKNLEKRRKEFLKNINNKQYIDYPTYLKFMEMI